MGILSFNQRLKSVQEELLIDQTIAQNKKVMIEANRQQLHSGFDRTGNRLRPYRNELYAEMKHQMNPEPGLGIPDLLLTGAFYAGFTLDKRGSLFGGQIEITSTDGKTRDLESRYGERIFGWTEASLRMIRRLNSRTYVRLFKRAAGMK